MTPEQIGLVAVLIAIGVAGVARKWVFGWVYDEKVAEARYWRDKALFFAGLASVATDEEDRTP